VERNTLADPGSGLLLALASRGYHVFSDRTPQAILTYGSWRVANADDVDAIVTMVAERDVVAGWQPPPHSRIVATFDPQRAAGIGYVVFVTPVDKRTAVT
jgi:hypothetical protein